MSGLRPPRPLFERAKLPLLLALYIGVMEWVDPFPFYASLPARVAVAALAFFVLRELWHARLEVDAAWAERSERTGRRWRLRAERIDRRTWLRFQRIAVWLVGALIFGAILNSITDRCDTALGCAVTAPRMAIENLPAFIQFAVFVALTLLQLAVMFWALIKVGSWKLVMPGTVKERFSDVWGQDLARDKVMEQVRLLDDSEAVEKAGGYMPRGLLLYGPPGTGKTLLAKAAAGESSKPLILVPPGAFQSTFVGINLLKVWMLFRNVRKLARRYGGCVAPGTLILTSDLRWVRADSLRVGDELLGVDEYGRRQHGRRRTRIGRVEALRTVRKQRYRVRTDRGSILVDDEHPFLARDYPIGTPRRHGGLSWRAATGLCAGDSVRWFGETWVCENGDSWLAGMLDGEGCLIYGGGHGRALTVTVNQNEGLHERLLTELRKRGFSPRHYVTPAGKSRNRATFHTIDVGGARAAFRLLGQVRPERLLANLRRYYTESEWSPALPNDSWATVLSVEPEDVGKIIIIQTSTHTYIADGFVSHNCIVFIDEIDSLGSRGGEVERGAAPERAPGCVPFCHHRPENEPRRMVLGTAQMGTLEAFLSAMDGMDEPRGLLNRLLVFMGFKPLRPPEYKALFMGATNMMGLLDPALLRAGRFGRKIHVPFPKVEGRLHTYRGYFSQVPHDLSSDQIEWAARNHESGTGAEIKDIVNEALLLTYRDERETPGTVHYDDLVRAMVWVRFGESEGPFEREAGRWSVAVHEAGHAVAFHLLNWDRQRIWFASIDQRGKTGGMVAPTPLREDWLLTRSEMLADIQVSLASRIAEELVLGEATNGNGGDNQAATAAAQAMIRTGLGGQIGAYGEDARDMRRQVEDVLREAHEECRQLLSPRQLDIERVARLLVERGTCPGDTIHRLLDEMGDPANG